MVDRRISIAGSILESDSPEPTLTRCTLLDTKDYTEQTWRNGLGKTYEIAIYPPNKSYTEDDFLWRLSTSIIQAANHFSLYPGYDCTTIVLPRDASNQANEGAKPSLALIHRGEEGATQIKPLFPYTWKGEWATDCKVTDPPIHNLQFFINRSLGRASTTVETVNGSTSHVEHADDTNRKLLLGTFTIIYVVRGRVRVALDENHSAHAMIRVVAAGETLLIEREEDASPTSLTMYAMDPSGKRQQDLVDGETPHFTATVVMIKIIPGQAGTSNKAKSPLEQDRHVFGTSPLYNDITPFRPPRRKGSLVVYDDQPIWNIEREVAKNLVIDDPSSTESHVGPKSQVAHKDADGMAPWGADVVPYAQEDKNKESKHSWGSASVYEPPPESDRYDNESNVPPPVTRDRLVIDDFPVGCISTAWIKMMKNGLSEWLRLPVIIARGTEDGPVLGITAALHGNELNGVPTIHRVVSDINVHQLRGTVVAIPCVNVVGYLKFVREFADGKDLNRCFPGKEDGMASQVYAHNLMTKIISQFHYLIDLHTASFGRVNSYYVRSDMNDPMSAILAHLQQPQVILHNSGQDGTLRSAAAAKGIKAITVEIGNPQQFQTQYVQWSYMGVMRILNHLQMFTVDLSCMDLVQPPPSTVLCSKGFWIYTNTGGVLEVYPNVNTLIKKGNLIARIKNIFGNIVDEYYAPCNGVIIGRSSNPVAMAGDRIIHLGVIKKKGEVLPSVAKENY
ncbi:hypothetical protein BZG36_01865 [Bifiguratus adelaidae]|uniref:Succinylglutamate desuccinylase/Aspartoacylase catalytic domain-containing protein n=1 Tax=Bifiguratus adelaidae TaxID=1938954 RepID=A0A261Y2F7_9FUNG|nr:hypothetical protein BZG36_01865 [Bifiguratus adelaidae]